MRRLAFLVATISHNIDFTTETVIVPGNRRSIIILSITRCNIYRVQTRRYLRVACYYEGKKEGSGAGVCVEEVWLAVQRRRPGVPRRSFGISLTPPLIISLFLPASS